MTTPRTLRLVALAAAAAALTACGGGDGPTPPNQTGLSTCSDGNGTVFSVASQPDASIAASAPGTMTVLGLGSVTTQFTAELSVHGNYAYTSTWGQRGAGNFGNTIRVWDVTGNAPRLLASQSIPGASTTGDVQVSDDGKLLVVATERTNGAIVVYDLADPRLPKQIAKFCSPETYAGVHTAQVSRVNGKQYAFLSIDPLSSNGTPARLVVVDLSDPAKPRQILARTMGDPFVHDVFVRDGILFTALWDAGLTIWDVGGGGKGGSPSNPVQMGNVRTVNGEVHNVWWFHDPSNGSKRYAFVGEEGPGAIGSSSIGDVHVVDVSDMSAPHEVAFFHVAGAGTHNFSVDETNGILYAAYYNAGVRPIDVRGDLSTCTATQKDATGRCDLTLMGRALTPGLTNVGSVYVWGVDYSGGYLYASDMLNGLWKLGAATR